MMKSDKFDLLKVKTLFNSIQINYF